VFSSLDGIDTTKNELCYIKKPSSDIKTAIYEMVNGQISSDALIDFLLPNGIQPHIFISHSSKDADLAVQFANSLYEKSKIISFIDSQFWNHIDIAIDKMHQDYCSIEGTKSYSYNKSNALLSNLHSILSISLMHMMDKSDSVIFIESENSIIDQINNNENWNTGEQLLNSEMTHSPWIYSEIHYANTLRYRKHERDVTLFEKSISKSGNLARDQAPDFNHSVDTGDFESIKLTALINAYSNFKRNYTPIQNLDLLYQIISSDNK